MEKKYSITNKTEEQLKMIQKSLDLYSRLGMLQFERMIVDEIAWNDKFTYGKNREQIDNYIKYIRLLLVEGQEKFANYSHGTWSLGIANDDTPKPCQSCYEMCSIIQDFLTVKNGGNPRGKLDLTDDEDIIVDSTDMRVEKILKILEKRKDKT